MIICMSKAGWDAISDKERNVLRFVISRLQLGEPAVYVDGPGASDPRWYTFTDSRMDYLDIAVLGCFAANRADLPLGYEIPLDGEGNIDKAQLRSDIASWLTNPARTYPFVHPDNVTPSGEEVSPQDVLDANNAPAVLKATLNPAWVVYDPEFHGAV